MQTIVIIVITIVANALANLLLKIGTDRLPPLISGNLAANFSQFFKNPWILAGALLFVTNFPLYNVVLQRLKLSIAFPLITSGAFALTVIFSFIFLKEQLTGWQYLGLFMLAASLWLIASGK